MNLLVVIPRRWRCKQAVIFKLLYFRDILKVSNTRYKLFHLRIIILLAVIFHTQSQAASWILIDNFEQEESIRAWTKADTNNETSPKVPNPQITERRSETQLLKTNAYLIKKAAKNNIVGNRKALTYKKLPLKVDVGETYTFYTRINVESFPNNHAFGLSNMLPADIELNDYNAFEPTLRVTDKTESSGLVNTGALMVKVDNGYANIINPISNKEAKPLITGVWYQLWYVVNNALKRDNGQVYDVYIQGGEEFPVQTKVYSKASFRMARELPLIYFLMNCNTGSKLHPYGNGGLLYDDLYMAKYINLSEPI